MRSAVSVILACEARKPHTPAGLAPVTFCSNIYRRSRSQKNTTVLQSKPLIGIVCDSLIDLGKVLTVEFTSAGTLTTLPLLGSSHICINGIRGEINLSSKGVKFKHLWFHREFLIFFALEQAASHYLGLSGK